MKTFKKLIAFLNKLKEIDIWGDDNQNESVSDKKRDYMDRVPTQNPYGLVGLILGGIAFAFGPKYGFIPAISLIFCIVTFFTFDKEKEDNPWPFYLGIVLSLIGLSMFISGEDHHLIL
ncbi:cell division protein FtsK [Sporosarcina sp. A2]|uniref:cell division protein FtsK n=1 Tax=Sporosarcina sp. A2 TaxID=3393449 RepID=UPI003D7AC6DB